MSIVRIGLGENKKFGDGYEAIFGKKSSEGNKDTADKEATAKKKKEKAKKPKKK